MKASKAVFFLKFRSTTLQPFLFTYFLYLKKYFFSLHDNNNSSHVAWGFQCTKMYANFLILPKKEQVRRLFKFFKYTYLFPTFFKYPLGAIENNAKKLVLNFMRI